LSNRFWRVIDKVLSDNQTTFIKGKLILNGVLIDNELVMKQNLKRKHHFIQSRFREGIQLDFLAIFSRNNVENEVL
jgi:hypothetical protein